MKNELKREPGVRISRSQAKIRRMTSGAFPFIMYSTLRASYILNACSANGANYFQILGNPVIYFVSQLFSPNYFQAEHRVKTSKVVVKMSS